MNDILKVPDWAELDNDLGTCLQMGYQTVIKFAQFGQKLKLKKGDQSLRDFAESVPRVGQHLGHLTKSTIHRYLTLADNLPLLEQKQPDSIRAALVAITNAKAPPKLLEAVKSVPADSVTTPIIMSDTTDEAFVNSFNRWQLDVKIGKVLHRDWHDFDGGYDAFCNHIRATGLNYTDEYISFALDVFEAYYTTDKFYQLEKLAP